MNAGIVDDDLDCAIAEQLFQATHRGGRIRDIEADGFGRSACGENIRDNLCGPIKLAMSMHQDVTPRRRERR